MNQARPSNYRFGDFELRIESETLLHKGVPVPLQRLPFLMLTMLLERPHQVVTREALQRRLWGPQGYLQFENGLRVATAKLREALGDTASSPKYIKTIPRLGYQFVGEDLVVVDAWTAPPASATKGVNAVNAFGGKPATSEFRRRRSDLSLLDRRRYSEWQWPTMGSRRMRIAICIAAAIFLVCPAIAWVYQLKHDTHVGVNQTVMLGSFYNETHDSQMDGLYDLPFHMKMQESQYLHLVDGLDQDSMAEASAPRPIPEEISLCHSAKASFLLTGLLERRGNAYAMRLSSWSCSSKRLLRSETAYAAEPEKILSALDTAAMELRQDLGESKESLNQLATPAAQATTSSLAALRAFHIGETKRSASSYHEAISYYTLATDLDPQFAIAFDRLGMTYAWTAQMALSKKALTSAFRLRDHATDHERLSITSHYYDGVTYDLPLAKQTYELWTRMYPNDPDPLDTLSDVYLKALGEPKKALTLAERAVALNPESEQSNINLAEAHLDLNDSKYFSHRCKNDASPLSGNGTMQVFCFLSFFNRQDEPDMRREVEESTGDMNQGMLLNEAGNVAIYRGQTALAEQLFLRSRRSLLKTHLDNYAAWLQSSEAVVEASVGLKDAAKHDAIAAMKMDRNPGTLGMGAWILAGTGDRAEAASMAKEANEMSPTDTLLNLQILGCANALLALESHHPQDAIQLLAAGRPYAFGMNTLLAPMYYRGLALEEQHDWKASIDAFQSLLDHRYLIPDSTYVALAKLELGHSFVEAGEDAHAAGIFDELELLWAHADRDFEPLKQLRTYERLHR